MKITPNVGPINETLISNLKVGTIFTYDNNYYLKIRPINLASCLTHDTFDLQNNRTTFFTSNCKASYVFKSGDSVTLEID